MTPEMLSNIPESVQFSVKNGTIRAARAQMRDGATVVEWKGGYIMAYYRGHEIMKRDDGNYWTKFGGSKTLLQAVRLIDNIEAGMPIYEAQRAAWYNR